MEILRRFDTSNFIAHANNRTSNVLILIEMVDSRVIQTRKDQGEA